MTISVVWFSCSFQVWLRRIQYSRYEIGQGNTASEVSYNPLVSRSIPSVVSYVKPYKSGVSV